MMRIAGFLYFSLSLIDCLVCLGRDRGSLYADSLMRQDTLKGASWSVLFYSLSGDSELFSYDPDRLLIPASTAKLATSSAALDILGSDHTFTTTFWTSGALDENGVLNGDLILHGGCDPVIELKSEPLIGTPVLNAWMDTLLSKGIRRITGNIVLQTWPFRLEVAPSPWEIGDINEGFAPAVDGFDYNSNVCRLTVIPGNFTDAAALVSVDPPFSPVRVESGVRTAESNVRGWVDFRVFPGDTTVHLDGEVPLGGRPQVIWVPVQDPSLYFGRALLAALSAKGIGLDGRLVIDRAARTDQIGSLLFVHHSRPLAKLLELVNKESDNFTAECILREMGMAATGSGTTAAGLSCIEGFLRKAGIRKNEFILLDGCGLARRNLCSSRSLVMMLRAMHGHPAGSVFMQTLSVAGGDGTLSGRLGTAEYAGLVRGKTGTMTHVSSVAGYATSPKGNVIAFAIMCNNFPFALSVVRAAQDRLIERVALGAEIP